MGVPAHHRAYLLRQLGEDLGPPVQTGVDQHHLLIAAGRAMTEDDRSETFDLSGHRVGQRGEELDLLGRQLASGPGSHLVRSLDHLAASQGNQFPVGVAPHQDHPIAQRHQPLQDGGGLRPRGVIAGDDHQIRARHLGLGQHAIEDRQDPVDVRQNRDRLHHPTAPVSHPPAADRRTGFRLWQSSPPALLRRRRLPPVGRFSPPQTPPPNWARLQAAAPMLGPGDGGHREGAEPGPDRAPAAAAGSHQKGRSRRGGGGPAGGWGPVAEVPRRPGRWGSLHANWLPTGGPLG